MNKAIADELYDKQFDQMLSFEEILKALNEAEARGRRRGLEEAAKVAFELQTKDFGGGTAINPGLRVKWIPKNSVEGTILSFFLDTEAPKRCSIEVVVRWDDGQLSRYGAVDFAKNGDIVVLEVQP